ncbi:MAG TPA: CoF synthetase [Beijerinckiaceae bacterium]|nr:CoF synthetase [Beijerinckiaceae bacterium]
MTQFLDVARGAYAKLPFRARAYLGSMLQFLPPRYRYGATYQAWRDRLVAARKAPEIARTMQDAMRVDLVRLAYDKSPYYRAAITREFGEAFDPASVLDPAIWQRLPLLSPETVSDYREALCTEPSSGLSSGSTGGTSGKPVRFFLDRNRSPIEYAFVFDAWSRVGYKAGDWRAVFRGVEVSDAAGKAIEKDPALAELRFSIFNLTDDLMTRFRAEILDAGIVYLHGYPSAIGMFASFLMRSGFGPMPSIRAIMLMGERLYPNYREAIEKAFPNAQLVPFFGLSEKCAFAVEVPGRPDVYDFEPLYGFTELLDARNRPVTTPGQRGRIVSTGLLFKGMPFLRYDTRDEATLIEAPTAANGWRLRLERIVPRRGHEFLVSRDGALIPILALVVFGTEMDEIREFQFVQDTPGAALLRIVRPAGGPEPDVKPFLALMERKSGGRITLTHEFVDALPVSPRAKRRFIDQRIDVSAIENRMNLAPDAVASE